MHDFFSVMKKQQQHLALIHVNHTSIATSIAMNILYVVLSSSVGEI